MPDFSWIQIKFLLQKHGWKQKRQEGSHTIWEKNGRTERIAVGHGHSMGAGGLKEIFKRFGIEMETVTESPKVLRSKNRLPQSTAYGKLYVPPAGTIGREIFDWRHENNVSAEALGKMVGVSGAMVALWENGKARVQPKWLPKLEGLHVIKSATQHLVIEAHGAIPVGVGVAEGKRGEKSPIKIGPGSGHGSREAVSHPAQRPPDAEAILSEPITESASIEHGPFPNGEKPTKDEKSFAHLIDADAIWIWAKELENENAKLKLQLQKAYSEDMRMMKEKAEKYDKLKGLFAE